MKLLRWLFWPHMEPKRPREQALKVLSGPLDDLFVMTKVDGVRGLASVGDLVRSYQKNRHADNRMRQAAEILNRLASKDATPQAEPK